MSTTNSNVVKLTNEIYRAGITTFYIEYTGRMSMFKSTEDDLRFYRLIDQSYMTMPIEFHVFLNRVVYVSRVLTQKEQNVLLTKGFDVSDLLLTQKRV